MGAIGDSHAIGDSDRRLTPHPSRHLLRGAPEQGPMAAPCAAVGPESAGAPLGPPNLRSAAESAPSPVARGASGSRAAAGGPR